MARQNYFLGGIVGGIAKAVGGSLISSFFGGGGGSPSGGGSGSSGAAAFLQMAEQSSVKGQEDLEAARYRNNAAAEKTAAILNGYLQEIPRDQRQATGQKLYDISRNG